MAGTDVFPVRSPTPEKVFIDGYVVGTGAANPTKIVGTGWTMTRNGGAGLYRITFDANQGQFQGVVFQLGGTTPTSVAGFSANWDSDSYNPATKTLDFTVTNASNVAADLTSAQHVYFNASFKRTQAQ